jgi:SAM-dependent methyltransferase
VKARLVELLACPCCAATLRLTVRRAEQEEIVDGALTCTGCRTRYPVRGGVPRFSDVDSRGHEATAAAFGYQWKTFSALDERYRRQFLDWVRPVEPAFFRDKRILEAGCGKGRHTALAAEFGARDIVALDVSEAANIAYQNVGGHPAVHIVQADLNRPPVQRVFDYAFSVGVLHHVPDPERGFHALVSKVHAGGHVSVWVYGREGNGWIVHLVSPIRERVTSRLPHAALQPLALALTVPLFLATRAIYRPLRGTRMGARLPYAAYLRYIADFPFREHRTIVFDHLVAPVAFYLRREEFAAWFDRAGLADVRIEQHNANSWRGFGRVPAADTA